MSEDERFASGDTPSASSSAEERGGASKASEPQSSRPSSPFDHPYFLPVLLFLFALWFGYDGWLNDDPEMQEHVAFNRNGFVVAVAAALYFTIQTKVDVPFLLSGMFVAAAGWAGFHGWIAEDVEEPFVFLYKGGAVALLAAALYFAIQDARRRSRARGGD